MKVTRSCPTLCDPMDYIVHGILQPRILDMGSLSLLQGIFPSQGSNPGLPYCRWIFLPAEPQGKPKNTGVGSLSVLQWISQPRNQTGVSCIAGRFCQLSCQGSLMNLLKGSAVADSLKSSIYLEFIHRDPRDITTAFHK